MTPNEAYDELCQICSMTKCRGVSCRNCYSLISIPRALGVYICVLELIDYPICERPSDRHIICAGDMIMKCYSIMVEMDCYQSSCSTCKLFNQTYGCIKSILIQHVEYMLE